MENVIDTTNVNDFGKWKKNIILFLVSQAISLFGSSLVQYAIIWYITLTTNSGVMLTISSLCGFLPQIFISIFAGVWADRYDRKTLIIVSDSSIAISTFILAIFFLLGINSIWLLFIALAIRSLGNGVQTPAVNAIIPQIVPEKNLMRINGISTTMQSIMLVLSPAASGAIIGILPIGNIFFIDIVTAIIGVGILFALKLPSTNQKETREKVNYYADIKEGLKYIKSHQFIRAILKFYGLFSVLIAPIALLSTLMITRSFGEEVWRLTANEIVFFVGSIVGGGIISAWGGFKNKIHTIAIAYILTGIFSSALGFSSVFIIYLIFMGILGIFMTFLNSTAIVIIQESVEGEMLRKGIFCSTDDRFRNHAALYGLVWTVIR